MLPRPQRVTKRTAWQQLHARGTTAHGRDIVLKYRRTGGNPTKVGFIVGTRTSKKATERNRVKRRLRNIIRKHRSRLVSGYDIALISRPRIITASFVELEDQVLQLLRKHHLCKL